MFNLDTHPKKLNLGVGAYRDHAVRPYVFEAVKRAKEILHHKGVNHEYLPIAGLPELREAAAEVVFGADSKVLGDCCVSTVQTLSGTGALRTCFDFLIQHKLAERMFIPNPTWGNHKAMLVAAGFVDAVHEYPYLNTKTLGLAFDGMMACIAEAPDGSAVLLQACAHNPTGVDPSHDQWVDVLTLCKERHFLVVFDFAYQGFATGDFDQDAFPIRTAAAMGMQFFVAQSFAKNLGLYSERVGALHTVCTTPAAARAVTSRMELIIRAAYSNPPAFGARVVSTIIASADLMQLWREEIGDVTTRIGDMRTGLKAELTTRGVPGCWDHVTDQIGMFTLTGLSKPQVEVMVHEHHVYMLANGRINMAGLSVDTIPVLVDAMAAVIAAGGAVAPKAALSLPGAGHGASGGASAGPAVVATPKSGADPDGDPGTDPSASADADVNPDAVPLVVPVV